MFLSLGLVLGLALTTSVANGDEKIYPFINMTDAKPYDKTPCPGNCGVMLTTGLTMCSMLLGNLLNNIPFPMDTCNQCLIGSLAGFIFSHKCFMNEENTEFDHYLDLNFPNFAINCDCEFSNSASAAAAKINAGTVVEGQCGKEGYKNKLQCETMTCEGSPEVAGESPVKLNVSTHGLGMKTIIRVTQDNIGKWNAFPLQTYLVTDKADLVSHQASPEFNDAWECFSKNMDALVCHLFANFQTPFYDCLRPGTEPSIIHALLAYFGQCDVEKKP